MSKQWLRKASLVLAGVTESLDLSEMHFRFRITQSNEESPNTAIIRVYNLSSTTVKKITNRTPVEFTSVELKVGYQDGSLGTIFAGSIKQYRRGRENATDTYFDILAAVSDVEYNFGVVNDSIPKNTPVGETVKRIADGMGLKVAAIPETLGGTKPRGKVLWGMGRVHARNLANSEKWGWSIQNGGLQMVRLDSYLPGEIVELNSATGMVGIPEQTDEGVRVRCLINPKLYIGGRMHINNADINQISQGGETALPVGQLPFDQRAPQPILVADVSSDGYYMMYVIEHSGDTRGREWYSDIVGLAMTSSTGNVVVTS